ncbi:uncharacterized protein LOC111293719 isoform X2 [Durio zibethinus]|uniref:Uncharacterized protein LOC111293719 isoform X2 n=1 Tax=Durio zibethinus TaxID=66656 RepID=A0A6P5YPD1_DURZI|nr:uncharacterized protein LOC111293719 isoform X2 [Durio zibethinus]
METNGSDHHPHENHLSTGLNNDNKDQSTEKEVFVNHAEITWLEIRRQWVGDQTQKSKRMPQEPIMRNHQDASGNINIHLQMRWWIF